MTIRTKLFTFISALVVLMNLVAFLIYESGRTIENSYTVVMDRILLYKRAAHSTEDNLRALYSYLIDQNEAGLNDFRTRRGELVGLQRQLSEIKRTADADAAVSNYVNLLQTFLDAENGVLNTLERKDMQSYVQQYEQTEKTAGYIQEEGQTLVDQELGYYQPYYQKMLVHTASMNRLGQSLVVVDVLMSLAFAVWLARSITRPIGRLVRTAQEVSRGNLEVTPPPVASADEVGILTNVFRQMLVNLRELIARDKESMEKDRLVKELEIKALQSQINPHFLFNTLNVISKLALIEGADRTSDLTVSVSNLLRYNLRKLDRPVTLREEVENAREYFSIQQSRFRDRISFVTDIDESLLGRPIPCLTLQPILENAFVHGIEGMEAGAVIRLDIVQGEGEALVRVSDNGTGMDEATRQSLLEYAAEGAHKDEPGGAGSRPASTGLGTRNVFRRLQLFYGTDDLVGIESREGEGTTVTLRIPDGVMKTETGTGGMITGVSHV